MYPMGTVYTVSCQSVNTYRHCTLPEEVPKEVPEEVPEELPEEVPEEEEICHH